MPATPSGADELANDLLPSLLDGKVFSVPTVDIDDDLFNQPEPSGDLYGSIPKIELTDLTTGIVDGTGVFDKLMTSLVAHLKVEFAANRISGAEYTKAYQGAVGAALQTAQTFLLSKDQAYWQALLVQQQARAAEALVIQGRLQLETARVLLVRSQYEAATAEANYGLTKIKIATEDAAYATAVAQKTGIDYTNANVLPKQVALLGEQVEVQRAQTMNTRVDGTTTVVGLLGKQKDLYTQQIASYLNDSKLKVGKLWTDAWMTQKTIDEGLLPPTQFTNAEVDEVLAALRTSVSLGS